MNRATTSCKSRLLSFPKIVLAGLLLFLSFALVSLSPAIASEVSGGHYTFNTPTKAGWTVNVKSEKIVEPVADSQVYAYSYRNWNKANWGKYQILGAGWHPAGGEKRAYLKFDLSGVDPKSVGKATLKLFHNHTGGNNSLTVGVHAVTGTWQEGGGTYHSGQTEKPAAPGEISWLAQPPFSPYQSANFTPGPGTNNYIEVDITQMVKQWLSGVPNNGLVLKATGQLTQNTAESSYGFYSREYKDKSKRPVLILSASSGSDTPTGSKHPLGDITRITDYPQAADNIRGVPCGSDRAFVFSLFQCILERDPDKREVDEQIRDLQNGLSRKDMVIRFFKSREYLNNNKNGHESYKDAFQAVLGRNPSSAEISTFPRTYPYLMAAALFNTEEYRNLCHENDDINKYGKRNKYNPLDDTGMGIPDTIQSTDKIDDLVNQYQDQRYPDTKKDTDQKEGTVYDQSPDYNAAVIGGKSAPVESSMSANKTNGCSGNYQEAYEKCTTAYNQLTTLMAQGKGDTPEAQAAYENYKFYKDCYEHFKTPAPSDHVTDTNVINTPTRQCADNAQEAYQQYLPAYNRLTKLMAQGKGDTPEAQTAYENYKFYKDCYEAVRKASPAPSDH